MKTEISSLRDCKNCKGTGIYDHVWNGKEFALGECPSCKGQKLIPIPDFKAIVSRLTKTNKKTNKVSLRVSKPDFENEFKNREEGRTYYVWRMIRFHGGLDVTMPVVASMCIRHDPYTPELDQLADLMAKKFCGTDLAAAYRWGGLLGYTKETPKGLPATAYESGPVCDENKPVEEYPELH